MLPLSSSGRRSSFSTAKSTLDRIASSSGETSTFCIMQLPLLMSLCSIPRFVCHSASTPCVSVSHPLEHFSGPRQDSRHALEKHIDQIIRQMRLPDGTGKPSKTPGWCKIVEFAHIQGASFCSRMLDDGRRSIHEPGQVVLPRF